MRSFFAVGLFFAPALGFIRADNDNCAVIVEVAKDLVSTGCDLSSLCQGTVAPPTLPPATGTAAPPTPGDYVYPDSYYPDGPLDVSTGMGTGGGTMSGSCFNPVNPSTSAPPKQHVNGIYLESWKGNDAVDALAWDQLTHVYYSFVSPHVDCTFTVSDDQKAQLDYFFQQQKTKLNGKKLRLIMAMGGWADTAHIPYCSQDDTKRATLVKNAKAVVDQYGFDGIDIDWEHPRYGGCLAESTADQNDNGNNCEGVLTDWTPGTAKPADWKFNYENDLDKYSQLIKDLRAALGWSKHLSYTLGIGGQLDGCWGHTEYCGQDRINMREMCQYANYMQLMTYDYRGNWDTGYGAGQQAQFLCDPEDPINAVGSWPWTRDSYKASWTHACDYTGAQDCPFPRLHTKGNIDWALNPWEPIATWGGDQSNNMAATGYWSNGGCPPERILIGLATYGRGFCNVPSTNDGIYQNFDICANIEGGTTPVTMTNRDINGMIANGTYPAAKRYDATAQPYVYSSDLKYVISYEDANSAQQKTQYALDKGMGGVFSWSAYGDNNGEIQKAAGSTIKTWESSH